MVTVGLLGNFKFHKTYTVSVCFHDVSGLPNKAKVKIAGVVVGTVRDITLTGDKACVVADINSGVEIHRDTKASIVSTGIIGSKYLQFSFGSQGEPILKDGDSIAGEDSVSLEQMATHVAEQIDSLFSSLKGKNGEEGFGENLTDTIANLKAVSHTLKTAIGDQEEKVRRIVNNVDSFTSDIAQITADNKKDIREVVTSIKDLSAKLDRVMTKIDNGDGTIGKLVSDKKMGEDLKDTFADVKETAKEAKRVLRRINYIETSWDYTQRYDSTYSTFRADAGLKIEPHPGKYYYIGASNISNSTTPDVEKQNTINFLIGKDFGPVEAYAGAIRSEGGIGVVVRPLWHWEPWRKLEITAQSYDFARVVPDKPVVNAGLRVRLTKWVAVGSEVEDMGNLANVNSYVNFTLRDDDLGYVLGLVGLARP
jgi:phospholipid/cholesterol/gamma-HCH transport system substrate-binding protein